MLAPLTARLSICPASFSQKSSIEIEFVFLKQNLNKNTYNSSRNPHKTQNLERVVYFSLKTAEIRNNNEGIFKTHYIHCIYIFFPREFRECKLLQCVRRMWEKHAKKHTRSRLFSNAPNATVGSRKVVTQRINSRQVVTPSRGKSRGKLYFWKR